MDNRVDGLMNKLGTGRPKIKGILVENELEQILVQTPREYGYQEEGWTVRLIIDYLSRKQIEVKEDTVRRALQKRGWVYKRFAKSVPKNAPTKEDKQKRVDALIDKINADDPDEVFFVDESNFTTGSYVQRGWFRRKEKKRLAVH
jgi:transposase